MTTTTHKRSVHVDAPVEKVFDFVKDPRHFFEAFPRQRGTDHLTEVTLTPEGVGSTYRWTGRMFVFHLSGIVTREEYVPNERIVDRSSTGPVWTWVVEPDPTGTTLTLAFEYSSRLPFVDKVVDLVAWHGDRDLDAMLADVQAKIEA
jgi:uncharacterized protein YndB with AHSA1/START domain